MDFNNPDPDIEDNVEKKVSPQIKLNEKNSISKNQVDNDSGYITSKIGKGENAKNSIVWTIIIWCLAVPAIITLYYGVTIWIIYFFDGIQWDQKIEQVRETREQIIKIWGMFFPIITLALGYIYGNKKE